MTKVRTVLNANTGDGRQKRHNVVRIDRDANCMNDYYGLRKASFFRRFDEESTIWRRGLRTHFNERNTAGLLCTMKTQFGELLGRLPYIGGDENHFTTTLVESAWFLAFFRVLQQHGWNEAATGYCLFAAYQSYRDSAPKLVTSTPSQNRLSPVALMQRRRQRAEHSLRRLFPADYVYEFVAGDGISFDYGYDFHQCAAREFYCREQADRFMPYYCLLDFPRLPGLVRTRCLSLGDTICNHRFRAKQTQVLDWQTLTARLVQSDKKEGSYEG